LIRDTRYVRYIVADAELTLEDGRLAESVGSERARQDRAR
jgi:hypothetical protein